jgi:4'-phosphopantetheinyl transferase
MLGPDEVLVRYCVTTALEDAQVAEAGGQLSEEEQERCRRFRFAEDRRDFAVAHALLRRTLSSCHPIPPRDWRFAVEAGGRPALAGGPAALDLSFNLSHTRGLVACGVVGRPSEIGVDVESVDRGTEPLDLAARYFSKTEIASIQACPDAERAVRFIEIWTLKEAYIKAIGVGLSLPLSTFSFSVGPSSDLRFDPPDGSRSNWHFALAAPTNAHRLAVAVSRASPGAPRISISSDPLHPAGG